MNDALVPSPSDNVDTINQTLQALGLMAVGSNETFQRAKINGSNIELGDEVYVSNQKTKKPAFFGRLLEMPIEYQAVWLTAADAAILHRPDAADRYCKSYAAIPTQAGKFAEDGTACGTCPVHPYTKKTSSPLENFKKCGFRADVIFQLTNELGEPIDDVTVWALGLAATSLIELKGMRNREPEKGFISEYNFMQRLARLGVQHYSDLETGQAVMKVGTLLKVGGVVASFRIEQKKSDDGAKSYPVVVLDPVNLIDMDDVVAGALASGQVPESAIKQVSDLGTDDFSDLPFDEAH